MSRFVVTANGDAASLRVRRGPSTAHDVSHNVSVGVELNSLEVRNVGSGSSLQRWHRIAANQWINEFQTNGAIRNCLAVQRSSGLQTGPIFSASRVFINSPGGANLRTAPVVSNHTSSGSLAHLSIHNWPEAQIATDPRQPAGSSTRFWVRLGARRWVAGGLVGAAAR